MHRHLRLDEDKTRGKDWGEGWAGPNSKMIKLRVLSGFANHSPLRRTSSVADFTLGVV